MNGYRLAGDMLHVASILLLLIKIHKQRSCAGISCKMQEMYLIVFCCRYLDLFYSFVSYYNSIMKIMLITTTASIVWAIRFDKIVFVFVFPIFHWSFFECLKTRGQKCFRENNKNKTGGNYSFENWNSRVPTLIHLRVVICKTETQIGITYDRGKDKFAYEKFLLGPCLLLGILFCEEYAISIILFIHEIFISVKTSFQILKRTNQTRAKWNTRYYWFDVLWTFSIFFESVAIVPQLTMLQTLGDIENLTQNFVLCLGMYRMFYLLNWIHRYFDDGYINWIGWIGGLVQTGLYADFFYYYAMSKWFGKKLVLPQTL